MVKGQPMRYVAGHAARDTSPEYTEEDRGYATSCWVWQHGKTPEGYGRKHTGGRTVYAHRYYYERVNGPIPDGLEIDHLCRVRECVNPGHLEAVTTTENIRRGMQAKLTPYKAAEIRRLVAAGATHQAVAERFGIDRRTVGDVVANKRWRV